MDNENWIEHTGGFSPLKPGMLHYRRYRDGEEAGPYRQATGIRPGVWLHKGDENDIIAYRIVDPSNG